jgi:hypothetical protein
MTRRDHVLCALLTALICGPLIALDLYIRSH